MKRSTFLASTAAGAAGALATPSFTLAAGLEATVKIGFLDSFSGVFTDQGSVHRLGADLALADHNRTGRVKHVRRGEGIARDVPRVRPPVHAGRLRRRRRAAEEVRQDAVHVRRRV